MTACRKKEQKQQQELEQTKNELRSSNVMRRQRKRGDSSAVVVVVDLDDGYGSIEIEVSGDVHIDTENFPLLVRRDALADAFGSDREQRVLYAGCGSGIIGILALRYGLCDFVSFCDVDAESVACARRNAKANGFGSKRFDARQIDLLADDGRDETSVGEGFDTVLLNPPQMPANDALRTSRPDKFGGSDGLLFYRRVARKLTRARRVVFMQTAFSSFRAANELFEHRYFIVQTVREQQRSTTVSELNALGPQQLRLLRNLRERGASDYREERGGKITYAQRLAVARRYRVGVFGAGCVGQFVGGHLRSVGPDVIFVGRRMLERTRDAGTLICTDFQRPRKRLSMPVSKLNIARDPSQLETCDAIFVCVKCGDTERVRETFRSISPKTIVISLQNGTENARCLREALPHHTIVAGMIPYGVNELAPGHVHRGSAGALTFDASTMPVVIVDALRESGLEVDLHPPSVMRRIQWFKLVVNLGNALNAIAGRPLAACLASGAYRTLLRAVWSEGLEVCAVANIPLHGGINGKSIDMVMAVLAMPDVLYRIIARAMRTTDERYCSSMLTDLRQRRATEIRELNGAIVALGEKYGVSTPVNRVLAELVRDAERAGRGSPRMTAPEIAVEVDKRAGSGWDSKVRASARRYRALLVVAGGTFLTALLYSVVSASFS
eukprot:g3280.t1